MIYCDLFDWLLYYTLDGVSPYAFSGRDKVLDKSVPKEFPILRAHYAIRRDRIAVTEISVQEYQRPADYLPYIVP